MGRILCPTKYAKTHLRAYIGLISKIFLGVNTPGPCTAVKRREGLAYEQDIHTLVTRQRVTFPVSTFEPSRMAATVNDDEGNRRPLFMDNPQTEPLSGCLLGGDFPAPSTECATFNYLVLSYNT
jgi:hypothetical protein